VTTSAINSWKRRP